MMYQMCNSRQPILYLRNLSLFALTGLLLLIGSAPAQTTWTKFAGNPVLEIGSPGSFESGHIWHHCVLFDEGIYKMWYTGLPLDFSTAGIGYATDSTDGSNWTKYSGNPVLSPGLPGSWEHPWVLNPVIIRDGDTLKMWYGGDILYESGYYIGRVGYAKSIDGLNWIKFDANPIMDVGSEGSWDDRGVLPQTVIFNDNMYHMWYLGFNAQNSNRIGYATSPDGTTWTKYNDPSTTDPPFAESDPVLKPGPTGSWDDGDVANHSVLSDGSRFHMWYEAFDKSGTTRVGYATSIDGISWVKYDDPSTTAPPFAESDPVLLPGPNGSWDDSDAAQPKVLFDGTTFHMWYIGISRSGDNFQIGYATAPIASGVAADHNTSSPKKFSLSQNYPNPFNPTTTIEYALTKAGHVRITIYDMLGRQVKTLVDANRPAGRFGTEWDGMDERNLPVAAGVYLYKMEAGDFVKVNKLALVR
jgi:predicted GH43/DUF377 family glycosyl hydrolase